MDRGAGWPRANESAGLGETAMKQSRLGDILLKNQSITKEQLEHVQRETKLSGDTITAQLIKQNIFTEIDLAKLIGKLFGRPVIDLSKVEVDPDLTKLSVAVMRKNMAIPIRRKGSVITLAVADPYDINSLDEIAFISGSQVDVVIVPESQLVAKLEELAGMASDLEDVMGELGAVDMEVVDTDEDQFDEASVAESEGAPVVKLVNLILLDAIKRGASDIHIEPYEKIIRVRYRIDGVMHEIMRPPMKMRDAIVSRIKIQARLDIAERRVPQDGRIKLRLSKAKTVDFRVSVLPTLFGEKVVMRLLDPSNLQLDMTKLGYEGRRI
jgi:type IV pilus assembly protein PilB